MQLALIFVPIIALTFAIMFLSRNDKHIDESLKKAKQNLFVRLKVTISSIIAPILIIVGLKNHLEMASILLALLGLVLIFQKKLFGVHSLQGSIESKIFGFIYLILSLILAFGI